MVRGPERLPAEEELQETLRGKLRVLQADSGEVTELSVHLLSISPEDKLIFITFKTFEEIWKFSTYYAIGFLGHCLEGVLFDPKLWLQSVEEDVSLEVSLLEDTLNLIYKGILMQEGLYLNLAPNERIIIVGLLVSCFDWFVGRKENTGEVGLVRTNLVKPEDTFNSEDVRPTRGTLCYLLLGSFVRTEDKEHDAFKMHIQRVLAPDPTFSQRSEETPKPEIDHGSISPSPNLRLFVPHIVEGKNHAEDLMPLFNFLENQDFNPDYGLLYRLTPDELSSTIFSGHSDEDQLTSFLSVARETARKKHLFWSQTRLCFLLGKLCVGRSKFSQARVYFEEAMSVPREQFADFRLLASIYHNLASIYLLQKNPDSFFQITEKLAALLMGFSYCLEVVEEGTILQYILKKAILSNSKQAEARASFLLAKHYWARDEKHEVIPYIERLLVISCEDTPTCSISPSCGYLTLGRLFSELHLANLGASSFRRASLEPSTTLSNSLSCILEVIKNLGPQQEASVPCHVAPYLHQVLSLTELQEKQNVRHQALSLHLTVCLSETFSKHRMLEQAIQYMHELLETCPSSHSLPGSQVNSALIWLAWLLIDNGKPSGALDVLELVLAAMPEHCTSPQEGEVLNLCGVALCSMGDLRRAVENYQAAIDICQEYEDLPNWAVAQANLGLLCLKAGATSLAQSHLTEAVQIFSELDQGGHEENFITVLLEMGELHVKRGQVHCGKGCYEWALLLAISNFLGELRATSQLCGLYSLESPDQAQCIQYSLHRLQLLQRTGDRAKTAETVEALSHLYLSLGTHKAYQAALDYTKSSLGMFIDLGLREKEAYGWLQAGKIYHLLGQTELVDLYVQAAQDVVLSTGDTKSILSLLEAAGDIFFNSEQEREKAITFYRDRALPIATKTNSVHSRLRLCNKLTELMLNLKMYGEAVEYAQTALDISIALGDGLNERVAYHRLASVYHCLQQFELAEHFYLKTLALCPSPLQFGEETLYYVRVYQTLGDIIFYDVKDPFDAAGYYHMALAAALDLGNKTSQLQLCTRLATIYHNFLMDRELSLLFYQRARGLAAELNVKRINIAPDQQLSNAAQYKTHETSWKRAAAGT
uniref:SH3 domain and tetratricopeptide repeats 1 n=1 Tax=Neogobius melanostomus TaxID=47308 RepID=A0A8C6T755_9GOBI